MHFDFVQTKMGAHSAFFRHSDSHKSDLTFYFGEGAHYTGAAPRLSALRWPLLSRRPSKHFHFRGINIANMVNGNATAFGGADYLI